MQQNIANSPQFRSFILGCSEIVSEGYKTSLGDYPNLHVSVGKKYIRVSKSVWG
jgi:hypothetical protein